MAEREHPYIPKLKEALSEGRIDRREFLRTATLLGLSAGAAYGFVGRVTGERFARPARAQMPKGGRLNLAMRVMEVQTPHNITWAEKSNIVRQTCEYLTRTGTDNITRPYLLEGWEASEDLKTWTLKVRQGIKWHNGRDFTADDVVWNLKHVLDPASGSSVMGLFKGMLLKEVDGKTSLWDAGAVEKVDDFTVRLNGQTPQLAVPENLFHYPLAILDPEEGAEFGPGANGTGAFELVEHSVGERAVLKARADYWGEGPYVDELVFLDLGDDPSAVIGALASGQVDGMMSAGNTQIPTLERLPGLTMYSVATAETGVVRGKVTVKPFDDPRVRKAMRLAIDSQAVLDATLAGLGEPAEHTHLSPIHPEYAAVVPPVKRDVAAAKALLAEAGHAAGIEISVAVANDVQWMPNALQVMKEQWAEAGITVNLDVMPGAQFWDIWDKVPVGFTIWYHRPLGVMVLGLGYRSGVPWNESEWSNKEFDALLAKAEGTLDVDERRRIMAEIVKVMYEDGPITQPFWRSVVTFYHEKVKGAAAHPTNYIFGETLAVES